VWFLALGLVLAACGGSRTAETDEVRASATPAEDPTESGTDAVLGTPDEETALTCEDPFAGETVRFSTGFWTKTDFCQHSVPYVQFRAGGPPPDGIPSIDEPVFETTDAGDEWLGDQWPVMVFEKEGEARAYPLAILILHEIVNDEFQGMPIAVTYCPLCNAAIVFNRQAPDGRILDFGTTGNLRSNDLVMYDRLTQSWWQQLTGEAVVGEYTGTQLEFLPSQIVAWGDYRSRYPDGRVLSRDTGVANYRDRYGFNPYTGYDSIDVNPIQGLNDDRLAPMDRVAGVQIGDESVVYPFSALNDVRVVNDVVASVPLVVFWQSGVKSNLDATRVEEARDVGSSAVYVRKVDDQVLTYSATDEDGIFEDQETGSRWNMFGEAISGPLEGTELEPVVAGEHFWFAWAAFLSSAEVWQPEG
jgi:hypothetical protein